MKLTLIFSFVLVATGCDRVSVAPATTRHYYVAAEPVDWSYAPSGWDLAYDQPLASPWGDKLVYPKLRYVGYTDETFTTPVEQPPWLGILGPVLYASVGDTIEVTFVNHTDRPLSMHPHGVTYKPEDEGAPYAPGGDARGVVEAGGVHTYQWRVTEAAGPDGNLSSRVWLYHSHVMADDDVYRGLVGAIIISDPKRALANGRPSDVDQELVTLFLIFNENGPDEMEEINLKHAINGLLFGNLQGLVMGRGQHVRWHLLGLGTEPDLHTPHWHGATVVDGSGNHSDVLELLPASMKSVDLVPEEPGTWLFHCHVNDHMTAGMYTTYTVE